MTHIPQNWHKSSFSGPNTNCIEIGHIPDGAAVRDTKNRQAGYFTATRAQWQSFMDAVKADSFRD